MGRIDISVNSPSTESERRPSSSSKQLLNIRPVERQTLLVNVGDYRWQRSPIKNHDRWHLSEEFTEPTEHAEPDGLFVGLANLPHRYRPHLAGR